MASQISLPVTENSLRFLVLLFSNIKHILWVPSTSMFFVLLKQFQNFTLVCFAFCVIQSILTVTKTLREYSFMTRYHLCFTLKLKTFADSSRG